MATKKRKARAANDRKEAPGIGDGTKALRPLDDSFEEWRHEPVARGSAYVGAVLLSFGGLLLGAGTYAMAKIADGPWHDSAWLLLLVGVVFEVGFLVAGGKPEATLRIGDLGVGVEEDGRIRRVAWCDITRVSLQEDGVKLETGDTPILIALDQHRNAGARAVAEAQKRVPKRVVIDDDDVAWLGKPKGGERVLAEPPQVTKAVCRATGEALTFEKDVRMCRACGALYHRAGVPRICTECSASLKSA